MRRSATTALLLPLALLAGCAKTILVPVPPRADLASYRTLGIVEFASNAEPAVNAHATRRFQEQVQAAQPGTRFIELGTREAMLVSVVSTQLDADAFRKVGRKYGVDAVFLGDIAYSDPKTEVRVRDAAKMQGSVHTEIRGDIASRLVETATGASVWSSSAWTRRQVGSVRLSEHGVSGSASSSNPRDEMVPTLIYQLTHDFRPSTVRQRVE
jgi:hypothetical protein